MYITLTWYIENSIQFGSNFYKLGVWVLHVFTIYYFIFFLSLGIYTLLKPVDISAQFNLMKSHITFLLWKMLWGRK